MPKPLLYIVYGLMAVVGLVAMYSLLNTGNPDSLLRPFIPNPQDGLYVAVVSSAVVFVFGFFVFYSRDREGFRHLVKLNADRIRDSRRQGKNDEQIADAILAAMGSSRGYRHNLARKKLMIALSEFK